MAALDVMGMTPWSRRGDGGEHLGCFPRRSALSPEYQEERGARVRPHDCYPTRTGQSWVSQVTGYWRGDCCRYDAASKTRF